MAKSHSKVLVLAVAFTLVFFVGLPKAIFAHPATSATAQAQEPQEGPNQPNQEVQDLSDRTEDLSIDLDVEELDGPNNDVDDKDVANVDDEDVSNVDAKERVEDQQGDQHEDAPVPPTGS